MYYARIQREEDYGTPIPTTSLSPHLSLSLSLSLSLCIAGLWNSPRLVRDGCTTLHRYD